VRAAQAYVETITGRKLVTQTWKWFLDSWPFGDRFDLPFGQLQSVTHVKYTDTAGTQTTFSTDYWEVSTARDPGVLALSYNQSWPSTTLRVLDPIEIQFICGWTTAADAPYEIQAAILLVATHFYENRSAVGVGDSAVVTSKQVELGAMALLANWIIR
jgi:uncharacterized phiE125 gp8 family phage protein